MRNLKKVLALVLAMAMSLSLAVTAGAAYKDGDKISDEYAVAVEVASQLGILEGFEDGTYGPQKTLTRAQLATMTYRIATGDVADKYTADFAGGAAAAFTDTAATAWYAGYVGYAADAGYLKGCGEGLYKPNSALTGYQALAAFLRVVGYNQPGQFTGADWTVQVAMIANEIGALEGVVGVDLNAAISREVAAQIIYNILFSDKVDYTPAFGYQNALGEDDLATDVFGIYNDEGKFENIAPWGRVATVWENAKGENVVTVMATPVATFKTAATQCEMSTAIGEDGKWDAYRWLNGALVANTTTEYNATLKTNVPGTAQGTLTEVYAVDKHYEIVEIETWLAEVTDVTAAKYDAAGHLKSEATADFDIYFGADATNIELKTTDYAKGDYALVNISNWEGVNKPEFFLTKTAPVATATQTYIDIAKAESTIGGTTYDWAAKYFMGKTGVVKTEYNVFVDFYGNLIGLADVPAADPVYTILDSGVKVTNGFNPYYAGKIVDLSDGSLKEVTVDAFTNRGDNALNWADDAIAYPHCIVSYTVDADGYDLACAATAWGNSYSIVKGTPRIVVGGTTYVTDAETVYAVEVKCGDYDMYTGYANVPSVSANAKVEVLDSDNDGYVDLVYVNATAALFAGEETFAYVMPSCAPIAVGNLANEVVYKTYSNVIINGEVVDVNCVPGFDLSAAIYDGKAVTLKANADGLVYDAVEVTGFEYSETIAKENSGEVIYVTNGGQEKSYVVTADTTIWVINLADSTVEVGTANDVDPGYRIAYKLTDGKVNADIIFLFDDVSADA